MKVYRYYFNHFNELTPNRKFLSLDKQFHFATRIKNWSALGFIDLPEEDLTFFKNYLTSYNPSGNIATIFHNNNFSSVNSVELRRPYFEKYAGLYGLEASLFYVHHLDHEFNIDLRPELLKLISIEELKTLANNLLNDPDAIATLSSFAINTLCLLNSHFFKIADDIHEKLINIAINYYQEHSDFSPLLFIYLITHIIICDSGFYSRQIPEKHHELYQNALKICEKIIRENPDKITLDTQIEFLVCGRLVGFKSELRETIKNKCNLENQPFITDPQKPDSANTLSGAEHRNVLFVMSGLDD